MTNFIKESMNKIQNKTFYLSYDNNNQNIDLSILGYVIDMYSSTHKLGELLIDFIYTDLEQISFNTFYTFSETLDTDNMEKDYANNLLLLHPFLFILAENYHEFIKNNKLELAQKSKPEKYVETSYLLLEEIQDLQSKYMLIINFCYSDIPELEGLSPIDRYNLFTKIYPQKNTYNNMVHYDLENERKVSEIYEARLYTDLDSINKLTDYLATHIGQNIIKEFENNPTHVKYTYELNIDSVCHFELLELIKNNIRLKKCENCHKYFVIYSRADTKYCEREFSEDGKTCRDIGATNAYLEKSKENPVIKIYSKFYKRYYARIKSNKLSKDEFTKWQKKASLMKTKVLNGNLSIKEFEIWLNKEEMVFNANNRKKR